MKRTASAVWSGDLKTGKGTLSSQSGILNETRYGFASRFEDGPGTNPEELIGAALAGCYAMALSAGLAKLDLAADRVAAKATVTLEPVDGNMTIAAIHLDVTAKIPRMNDVAFQEHVRATRESCIVRRALNATITVTATLEV